MNDLPEDARCHNLLHLVEERLQAVLLEREECLAGGLLRRENAIDIGDLSATAGRVSVKLW